VIQGVYPIKPAQSTSLKALDGTAMTPITIVGNEACGIVEGTLESKFKVGDRVIMGKAQLSTWQRRANLPATSLIRLPATPVISAIAAATLSINPLTAYRLLSDFVPLNPRNRPHNLNQPPQFVIQNAANSAVGEAVIQIGKLWKVKTINLIRDRFVHFVCVARFVGFLMPTLNSEDIDVVKSHLSSLGADVVLTYSEFLQRESRSAIKELVQGAELRLALNCVGGDETTEMAKLLNNGHLVTYGGMAKRALKIPPSLFIFKQLTL
jgi:trans-2-enoyl-CoA reductase